MFKVLKIIWNGDFLFLYITAFSRYNWCTINYTDLKCTGWILTYVYFQETDTIISVITSKLSSYPFIIHLHLYPYPQEATLLLTITVSMYGFSRILYGWNHSVYAISRDVGSDLFHSVRGESPVLFCESIVCIFPLLFIILTEEMRWEATSLATV